MSHEDHVLTISVSKKSLGKVTNESPTWGELIARLSKPATDKKHTLAQYLALPRDEQSTLKNRGFMVGGHCTDGIRKAQNIAERSCLCFDIDEATPKQITVLKTLTPPICDHEFFAHTTRKHTPEKPRWRVVVPLARPVPPDQFAALSRIVAAGMFLSESKSMDAVDDVSYRIAQVMYWPSVCSDGVFETLHCTGNLLDPDVVLESFGNWQEWKNLPFSEDRSRKRPSDPSRKAADPRTKAGIIGAFCRAYSIPDVIDKFLATSLHPWRRRRRQAPLHVHRRHDRQRRHRRGRRAVPVFLPQHRSDQRYAVQCLRPGPHPSVRPSRRGHGRGRQAGPPSPPTKP